MPLPNRDAWQRLRELDDPDSIERPADLDEQRLHSRFTALVHAVSVAFQCECPVDAGFPLVQDATFYGTIRVPGEATRSGAQIVMRVSNFGSLATYDLELFGAYSSEERHQLMDPADVARAERALTETGHEIIPIDILWNTYDGASDYWKRCFPDETPPTWFIRFFDWV